MVKLLLINVLTLVPKTSKKRAYSRGGCNECRRRRIKCDETKPFCINCTRLNKACVYQKPKTFHHENVPKAVEPVRPFRNHISEILTSRAPPANSMNGLFDDASLLVSDINGLLDIDALFDFSAEPLPLSPLVDMVSPSGTYVSYTNPIPTEELLNQVISQNKLTDHHEKYLRAIATTDLSFHLFPFSESVESNQVVNILLRYSADCPHLLTSLLGYAATFLFNRTADRIHCKNRAAYLGICLKELTEVFKQRQEQVECSGLLMNNIERLLLTILLLTASFTSSCEAESTELCVVKTWHVHVRSARHLLSRYNEVIERPGKSPGLALAKTWFFSIEMLAKARLSSTEHVQNGECNAKNSLYERTGYFTETADMQYHTTLMEIGLLKPSSKSQPVEFNLFLGFLVKYVMLMEEFVAAEAAQNGNTTKYISSFMCQLKNARDTEYAPGVDPTTYAIPSTSPAHPRYSGPDRIVLPSSAYSEYEGEVYSWFDLCEQIRIDSLYLRLLRSKRLFNLPKENFLVQQLVDKIFRGTFFIRRRCMAKSEACAAYVKAAAKPEVGSASNVAYTNAVKPEGDVNNLPPLIPSISTYIEGQYVVEHSARYLLPSSMFDFRAIMVQGAYRICLLSILPENVEQSEQVELLLRGLLKLGNGSSQDALDRFCTKRGLSEEMIIPFA